MMMLRSATPEATPETSQQLAEKERLKEHVSVTMRRL